MVARFCWSGCTDALGAHNHTSFAPSPLRLQTDADVHQDSPHLEFDTDDDDEGEKIEIPLPNVKSEVLRKVVEFCEHHLKEPMTEIEIL